MRSVRRTLTVLALPLLAACAAAPQTYPSGEPCITDAFVLSDDFDGARRGSCTPTGPAAARIEIEREDDKVRNPSPWFAFKLQPSRPAEVVVELDYGTWRHRYLPKTSRDGRHWSPVDAGRLSVSDDGRLLRLRLEAGADPAWIAAQELVMPRDYDAWMHALAARPVAVLRELGRSVEGRAIRALDSAGDARDVIVLVGRQHPPEVSGAIAMQAFVETLFSDSPDAAGFRQRFRVIAVPLLNPDGVVDGHWRHNRGAVDLNRDWGPFTQPETQSIAALLDELDAAGAVPRTFIDFHSTDRNLFYTQAAGDPTEPPRLTDDWFARVRERLEDYAFTAEPRAPSDTPNGKNYMYRRYGIPSLTYEVGDETDRRAVVDAARVFAEEFMRTLTDWQDRRAAD